MHRTDPRLAQGLRDLIEHTALHSARMVEVGSLAGESAVIFAESGRFERVTCVDPWAGDAAAFEDAFDDATAGHAVIEKLKAASPAAAELFPDASLDLVYIDGDHRFAAVVGDIRAWLPKLKADGWLAGHDFAWRWKGVIKAVWQELGVPERVFQDKSWLIRKPDVRGRRL